jgi:ectoine hydroxylase-related dioxygenase (phytanoyl-CoA dioxygenase family)
MRASTISDPGLDELSRLQLERNALELEVSGYTVIEDAIDPDLTKRALEATLRTFGERTGSVPDVKTGEGFEGYSVTRYLLLKDPAFERVVMSEKILALVDYLIGDDCLLSTLTGHIRGQGGGQSLPNGYLPLHGDDTSPLIQAGVYNLATVNICLTDLTEESGCLAFVPGSHKELRKPTPHESVLAGDNANPRAVPLVAPAGSAVIWPSHTWHGSWESHTPGLRITLAELFCRPHWQPYELYRENVTGEMLERNSERFSSLVGMDTINGWNDHHDDWGKKWVDRDRSRYAPQNP